MLALVLLVGRCDLIRYALTRSWSFSPGRQTVLALTKLLSCAACGRLLEKEAAGETGHALPRIPSPDELIADDVILLEAAPWLAFVDADGTRVSEIIVSPGRTLPIRVDNIAGFDHSFYIGTEEELAMPGAKTDTGIGSWSSGEREFLWTVPDEVSGLMFGCTVPGHFGPMNGRIVLADTRRSDG